MANGTDTSQKNHVRFIAACITLLGVACVVSGAMLIWRGYGGDLLIGGGLAAISGLCGFLGAGRPNAPGPDISVNGQPPKIVVKQPETEEVKP